MKERIINTKYEKWEMELETDVVLYDGRINHENCQRQDFYIVSENISLDMELLIIKKYYN